MNIKIEVSTPSKQAAAIELRLIKMFTILHLFVLSAAATSSLSNLSEFRQELFWDEPKQGLFNVDVGLGNSTDQHLEVFADLNNDKYTDVITVGREGADIQIHLFNSK